MSLTLLWETGPWKAASAAASAHGVSELPTATESPASPLLTSPARAPSPSDCRTYRRSSASSRPSGPAARLPGSGGSVSRSPPRPGGGCTSAGETAITAGRRDLRWDPLALLPGIQDVPGPCCSRNRVTQPGPRQNLLGTSTRAEQGLGDPQASTRCRAEALPSQ